MKKYAIMYNPGHNRIYYENSLKLSVSEFSIVSQEMSQKATDIKVERICGIDYLTFSFDDAPNEKDFEIISSLSFVFAVFELSGESFIPIQRTNVNYIDESVSSILKYSGKTNELFTRMMINIAFSCAQAKENVRLLDPLAGKGTTLYEGLIKGFDVYGIEVGEKVVNESYHFLKKFCEMNKYKHNTDVIRVSGPNKSFTATKYTVKLSASKTDFKEKKFKTAEFISGNALNAADIYKKNFFDIIVGDLPYGIQHGNVTNEKQNSLTRNPTQLLRACLPVWKEVLKPSGVIALSWNCNVLTRLKAITIFKENGFEVFEGRDFNSLEHRVDQAIIRDIIVAKKL